MGWLFTVGNNFQGECFYSFLDRRHCSFARHTFKTFQRQGSQRKWGHH